MMYVSIEYFRLSPKVLYSVWNVMTQIQLIAQLEKTKNISISHRNFLTTTYVLMHHPKAVLYYHRVNSNPGNSSAARPEKSTATEGHTLYLFHCCPCQPNHSELPYRTSNNQSSPTHSSPSVSSLGWDANRYYFYFQQAWIPIRGKAITYPATMRSRWSLMFLRSMKIHRSVDELPWMH